MTPVDQALVVSEWVSIDDVPSFCPSCREGQCAGHAPGCAHDLALAERGYPDQESRDRARASLQAAKAPTEPPPKEDK